MWLWSQTISSPAVIVPRFSPYGWVRAVKVMSSPMTDVSGSAHRRISRHGSTTSTRAPGMAVVWGSPS
jgi:hypothetical protein